MGFVYLQLFFETNFDFFLKTFLIFSLIVVFLVITSLILIASIVNKESKRAFYLFASLSVLIRSQRYDNMISIRNRIKVSIIILFLIF